MERFFYCLFCGIIQAVKKINKKMEEKRKKIILWLLILLCASFVVGSTIFLSSRLNHKLNPEIAKEIPPEKKGDISGKIYLSLVPDSNPEMNNEMYYYDIEGRELRKFFKTENAGTNYLGGVFSSDGKNVAFATSSNAESTKGQGQIFVAGENGLSEKQITNSSGLHKRNPQWSPDGKRIAFQHLGSDKTISSPDVLRELENWNISVTDLEGKETFITKGLFPHFLSDEKILVLKNDGFYVFNMSGEDSGKLLWNASGEKNFDPSMQFSVSRDGKMLAWTVPVNGKVFLMKISSWDPFSVEKIENIDKIAYWPIFSPDGKYLAIEEVDENNENPKIFLYNTENLKSKELIDLSSYDQSSMFISSWELN